MCYSVCLYLCLHSYRLIRVLIHACICVCVCERASLNVRLSVITVCILQQLVFLSSNPSFLLCISYLRGHTKAHNISCMFKHLLLVFLGFLLLTSYIALPLHSHCLQKFTYSFFSYLCYIIHITKHFRKLMLC